jgi:3-methyl-2-oxobutanoate hydroxymethyltransferase
VLGLIEGKAPRHAKRFGEVGQAVEAALKAYVEAVQTRSFPTGAQSASMTPEALEEALRSEKP